MPLAEPGGKMIPGGHCRGHRTLPITVAVALSLVCLIPAVAAVEAYRPGLTIALEVRTPQGDLRSFQRPGQPPSYWAQGMPVVRGDQVTIAPLITTGGAELGEVVIRLDHVPLVAPAGGPCRVQIDTSRLAPGYHSVEVWAATKAPRRAEGSAAATFLVVPPTDPLLQVLNGEANPGPEVTEEERLSVTIRSLDPRVESELAASSAAVVSADTLFAVVGGPDVREHFYTISRDGAVTYTSPRLPISTQLLLGPSKAEGAGLAPGKAILTVRGGDGAGRFGAPAWVTVDVAAPEAPK
jgi:hypothetical protein